ncbi:MAG: DUF4249 domain-containing protein [Cytophagales bacterium]|nr:DUF4249 domain-containing protein [Cytophagales bacterium]
MNNRYFKIFALLFLFSCTEDYTLEFEQGTTPLVIEANLDNLNREQSIRLTRLSRTVGGNTTAGSSASRTVPVEGAVVKVTEKGGSREWVFTKKTQLNKFNGYYANAEFRAVVGKTYTLSVTVEGKVYTASSSVPAVPVIDGITVKKRVSERPGKDNKYVPYISFNNAPGKDFYLLESYEVPTIEEEASDHNRVRQSNNRRWAYSVLSDKFLSSRVSSLLVDDGQTPNGQEFFPGSPGGTVRVYLSSLTQGAYSFYEALIEQFNNDGGVLSPTPASAPTNLSNGAIGFFRLSAVSYRDVEIPSED